MRLFKGQMLRFELYQLAENQTYLKFQEILNMSGYQQVDRMLQDNHFVENLTKKLINKWTKSLLQLWSWCLILTFTRIALQRYLRIRRQRHGCNKNFIDTFIYCTAFKKK